MTSSDTDGDARLEARLRALADAMPRDPNLADRVLARIAADDVRPQSNRSVQLRRWIVRSSIGLAATVGLAAGVWSLVGTPRPAFAVEDVAARLRSLHSLHLKGVFTGDKNISGSHPFEMFLRAPDCMRVNGHLVNDNGRLRILDMVYAPDRFTLIDETDRTVTTVTAAPPTTQNAAFLRNQVSDQMQTFLQMMFGPDQNKADFHLVRSETIDGVVTDVYACPVGDHGTVTVWLNPTTRLPVRTSFGPMRFDTIEADPAIPDAVFHPPLPVGYAVVHPKPVSTTNPDSETAGGCSVGDTHLNVTTLLSLPNGDVLACWHLYDARACRDDLKLPDTRTRMAFTSSRGVSYTERLLHADETPAGWHWRWSLLHPDKQTTGSLTLLKAAATCRGGVGSTAQIPLMFPPDALAQRVESAQRLTLPPGATPMSLEQIEAASDAK